MSCERKKWYSFVYGKVEYVNKNCLWFSFTKPDMYLVYRVFISLWYACGFSVGTCILFSRCIGFYERFIRVYFYWVRFFIVFFLVLIFDARYFASR